MTKKEVLEMLDGAKKRLQAIQGEMDSETKQALDDAFAELQKASRQVSLDKKLEWGIVE